MKKSPAAWLAAAIVFASASALADDAPPPMPKEFEVVLTRPMAPGDIFDIEERISITRTVSKIVAGEPPEEHKDPRSIELAGTMVVAAVDAAGAPSEFSIKVKNLSGIGGDDEQRRQYVAEGTEIFVKRSTKQTVFSVPQAGMGAAPIKADLGKDAQIALTLIYPKLNASNVTDDQVYPAKGPRKPGDSWDADLKAVTAQAAGDEVTIDPLQTAGSATLRGARRSDSGINLTIETKIEAGIVSVGSLPANVKLSNSSMKAANVLILPADPKAKSFKQELNETLELKSVGADSAGKPVVNGMRIEIQHSQTITQVKSK